MQENNEGKITISIGIIPILTIVFVILKLCKVISWSWVWVLAPLWIPLSVTLVFFVGFFALLLWASSKR